MSSRTVKRRLSRMAGEGALYVLPSLDTKALAGAVMASLTVEYEGPESRSEAERVVEALLDEFMLFAGIWESYSVFTLILPSVPKSKEILDHVRAVKSVRFARIDLVAERIELYDDFRSEVVAKAMMEDSASHHLRSFERASFLSQDVETERLTARENKNRSIPEAVVPIFSLPPTRVPDLRRTLPLIDRESELASLKGLLDAAIRKEGTVVFVTGEGGIGKTRLAEELMIYATERGARALSGKCLEKELGASYSPWVEIVRSIVSQSPQRLLQKAAGTYANEIAKLVPEVLEKMGPLPSSATSIQLTVASQADQERIRFYEGIAQFFVNLSRESPLLLLLDDFDTADTPSIYLLRHLARNIKNESIMIVGTYRDADLEKTSPLLQLALDLNRNRLLNTLRLGPLDMRSLTQMIAETFGQRDEEQTEEFRDLIMEKTGGNPFFVEEVLRSLVERGAIYRTDKGWHRKTISEIEVPPTVKLVIEQRLSRLDEESIIILTAAAVLGKEFGFELLQRLTDIDEETLLERVEKILKSHLLSERKFVRGSVYEYTDLQVRDVLLEGISLVRRRKYHLKAARAIEELYRDKIDERVAELAYHFLEGNDPDKALHYCVRAGERASKVYAHEEASKQFKIALDLLEEKPDEPLRAKVLESLGDATALMGNPDATRRNYDGAAAIYERLGERRKVGSLYSKMFWTYYFFGGGDYAKTKAALDKAMEILTAEGQASGELAYLYQNSSIFYMFTGQHALAGETAQKALDLAKNLELPEVEALTYNCVLANLSSIAEMDKMVEYQERGLRIALQHDLPFAATVSYFNEASAIWAGMADMEKSARLLKEGREYAKKRGYLFWELWDRSYEAQIQIFKGNLEEATRELKEASDQGSTIFPYLRTDIVGNLGQLYLRQGDLAESERYLKEQLSLLEGTNDWHLLSWCYLGLGHLYLKKSLEEKRKEGARAKDLATTAEGLLKKGYELLKDVDRIAIWATRFFYLLSLLIEAELKLGKMEDAKSHLKEMWDNTKKINESFAFAFAHYAEGLVSVREKDWENAITSLRRSSDDWERVGWVYERAQALLQLGFALQLKGDRRAANEPFSKALEIFTRMGAKLDMERVLARKELLKV